MDRPLECAFHSISLAAAAVFLIVIAGVAPSSAAAPATRPAVPDSTIGPGPAGRPPERPLYYDRKITPDDLEGRTIRELHLMRNWIYARAGNPFRKSWLREFFNAQSWYRPLARMEESKLSTLDRANALKIVAYEASLTRADLSSRLENLRRWRRAPRTPEDRIEIQLLQSRLQVPASEPPGSEEEPTGLLEDAALLDHQITLEQLRDLSRRDLRIVRNMIYARHGRPFKSQILKEYFGTLAWYKEDSSYTDARLRPVDLRNIKLIRSLEDELGGPVGDEWFIAA